MPNEIKSSIVLIITIILILFGLLIAISQSKD